LVLLLIVSYQWMIDCLRTSKPSGYVTNTKVNSAFYPSGVGESSTGLSGWGYNPAQWRRVPGRDRGQFPSF